MVTALTVALAVVAGCSSGSAQEVPTTTTTALTTTSTQLQAAITLPPPTTTPPSTTSTIVLRPDEDLGPVCGLKPGDGCRIIAYYGNPLSKRMGVLGETPPATMIPRLQDVTRTWQQADPSTPTRCAMELIAVAAQGEAGSTGLYRARMGAALIDQVIGWARKARCLTVLDVQVGHGSVRDEVDFLRPWLEQPDVHLGLDPEWMLQPPIVPGKKIGSMPASDINYAITVLDQIVTTKKVGTKLLVVHRFRDFMVKEPRTIRPTKTIRLLVNMDGFGPPATKLTSYKVAMADMPTRLTGFKLFYKNDQPMLTPAQLLALNPAPHFINYQ